MNWLSRIVSMLFAPVAVLICLAVAILACLSQDSNATQPSETLDFYDELMQMPAWMKAALIVFAPLPIWGTLFLGWEV